MSETDLTKRKLLKILAGAVTSQLHIPNIYAHSFKNKLITKFGLTNKAKKNLEILKTLSPEEFDMLYKNLGFNRLKNLVNDTKCSWYPTGNERIKNMEGLLDLINMYSNSHDLRSNRIFSHVFVESGGYNNLNCEVGGGVMHLRYLHWEGINPLDEEQNIRKGVKYISRLKKEFGDEDLASLSFNIGDSRVRRRFSRIKDYFKFKKIDKNPSYEDVIWLMEKQSPFLANLGKNYMGLLERSWNFVERKNLFTYNSKKNLVESVAKKS